MRKGVTPLRAVTIKLQKAFRQRIEQQSGKLQANTNSFRIIYKVGFFQVVHHQTKSRPGLLCKLWVFLHGMLTKVAIVWLIKK